jgi:hypothetical protein
VGSTFISTLRENVVVVRPSYLAQSVAGVGAVKVESADAKRRANDLDGDERRQTI